jgi:hypothetical protein
MSTTRTALRRSHSVPVPVPSSPIYSAPAKVTKPNQLFSFSKPGDDHSCDDVFTVDNSPPDITAGALRISSPDSDFDSHPSIPLTPESRSFASPGDSPSPRDSGKRSTGPLRSTKKVKGYQPYTESPLSAREDRRFAHLIGRRVYEDSCASGISDTVGQSHCLNKTF